MGSDRAVSNDERFAFPLSLLIAHYLILVDWTDHSGTLHDASTALASIEGLATDGFLADLPAEFLNRPLSQDAVRVIHTTESRDDDALQLNLDTYEATGWYTTGALLTIVRANHDDLRWLVENALLVGIRGLLDAYLNNVIRLNFYASSAASTLQSGARVSEADLLSMFAMAEDSINEEAKKELRELLDAPIGERLRRLGVPVDSLLKDDLYRLNRARNVWVHETEMHLPKLHDGMVQLEPNAAKERTYPTPESQWGFLDAYRVAARVASRVHDMVWPDSDDSRATIAAFATGMGLSPEDTVYFWFDDPFGLKRLAPPPSPG
jgi:hypothetical protein